MRKILPPLLLVIGLAALFFVLYKPNSPNKTTNPTTPIAVKNTFPQTLPQEVWVPILVYHHIGTPPPHLTSAAKSLFIEPTWFEKHLQYLQAHNFNTIRFSDLAAYFNEGTPLPDNPVMINFDDGWANTATAALPLLQKYSMTATAFIVTNYPKEHGEASIGYMSWDQIKTLRDSGIEIGSHTLRHPKLTKVPNALDEITRSKKILEDKLGISVTTFAYPFGHYNEKIEQMVRDAGYTTGRSFSAGKGISTKNLFRLPVVSIYANADLGRWKKQLFKNGSPD